MYYPPAVAWLQGPMLPSGQCQIKTSKTRASTGLLATSPATLHDHLQLNSPPKLNIEIQGNVHDQPRRTVLCMLSMDPQCTHILFSVKNGYKRDLLIMFFCSFLSRTDVKNTMVRCILQTRSMCVLTSTCTFCGMLVNTNVRHRHRLKWKITSG